MRARCLAHTPSMPTPARLHSCHRGGLTGVSVTGTAHNARCGTAARCTGVAVPDVTCELPRAHSVGPYLCLPTWDTNAVAVTDIERGVDWALAQRAMGRAVVVHCAHGHGRSATVMAACLLARGLCLNARDAEKYMQRSRPRVRLSRRQRASLEDWVAWRLRVRLAGCEGWGVRVRLKEGVVSLAMGSVAAASRGG